MLTGTGLRAIPTRGQGPVAMTARERAQALAQVGALIMQAQTRACSIPDPPGCDFRSAAMGLIADAAAALAQWESVERARLA